MVDGFRAADDPDVTVRLDPAAEAAAHGLSLDEVAPAEDYVGWDLHFGARITFSDDMQFYDGRGLHYLLSVGPDMPRGGLVIKTVTPEQLQEYARSLLRLANRAAARRAVVVIDGQLEIGDFIADGARPRSCPKCHGIGSSTASGSCLDNWHAGGPA